MAAGVLLSGCASVVQLGHLMAHPYEEPVPNVSPHLEGNLQGIASDAWGDHYISFTDSISAYDSNWTLVWTNRRPFAGIGKPLAHVGDVEYFNGLIYAPVERWEDCDHYSPVLIAMYDARSGSLVNWVDITGDAHEASAVTIVAESGQVVVSSFCHDDGGSNTLWSYDLRAVTNARPGSVITEQRTIELSSPIRHIQGISWNPQAEQFLVSADMDARAGTLWLISAAGSVAGPVYTVPSSQGHELEGVDATEGNAYYAEDGYVYGIPMPGVPTEAGGADGTRPQNDELRGLPFLVRAIPRRDRMTESPAGNAPQ